MSKVCGNKSYCTVHCLPSPGVGVGVWGELGLLRAGTGVVCRGFGVGQQRAVTCVCCSFTWGGEALLIYWGGTNYSQVRGIYLECRYCMVCFSGSSDSLIIGY